VTAHWQTVASYRRAVTLNRRDGDFELSDSRREPSDSDFDLPDSDDAPSDGDRE